MAFLWGDFLISKESVFNRKSSYVTKPIQQPILKDNKEKQKRKKFT